MSQDKELEIRQQFLDEAEDYLQTLDEAVLGISDWGIDTQKVNAALRAAHSIKGGAGMMRYDTLSSLAHRIEDFFKVLKIQKQSLAVDPELEQWLLSGVDCLRQVIRCDRQLLPLSSSWLEETVNPLFEQLHQRLGEPPAEDASSVLSTDEGQDILPLVFQTEVEAGLAGLEEKLAIPDSPDLRENLVTLAQELEGLGEMLQLSAFSQLSHTIAQMGASTPDIASLARTALHTWRQSQTLVLSGQWDLLPTTLPDFAQPAEASTVAPVAPAAQPPTADPYELHPILVTPITPEPHSQTPHQAQRSTAPPPPTAATSSVEDTEADSSVRVSMRQLNQLNDLFGELTIDRNALELHLKRLHSLTHLLSQRVRTLEQANTALRTTYDRIAGTPHSSSAQRLLPSSTAPAGEPATIPSPPATASFDTLELDRYSALHLLSQEVMETIVQVQEVTSDIDFSLEEVEHTSRSLNKTAHQLQTRLTQVRMRPLSDIVDRFPRVLRELCLEHGKQVRLEVSGANTLIDRTILETLNDPLLHLLRNAFDHGIEDPQTRIAQGKAAEGVIQIQAGHRGNRTIITLSDDGAGIPLAKIRAKAEQMGLDPVLLAAASDDELVSLIFEPGFSTTDQVTALSGRGVGMDIVRDRLKQARGDIKVETKAGQGTTFTLSLPFTLSVVRVLLVESNGLLLAIPNDAISEILALQPDDLLQTAGKEMLNLQGSLVQFIRLSHWLTVHCPTVPYRLETPPTIATETVLLVEHNHQLVALQLDCCWGEQEVAVRRVNGSIPLPPGFSNCTILGDGRVVPLINMAELLHWIASLEASGAIHPPSPVPPSAGPALLELAGSLPTATILVIDDSINVRRFLALTLEKAGYQVEQAKDGQEALEKLQGGIQVNAVICDIEMPRLDGYGFLARVKAIPALAHLPVTMLTSRTSAKHRQLALSLGASAYFSKPYHEQDLLTHLAEHLYGTSSVTASVAHQAR
jgi:chemosensory pili system protein ChpA (sensor histidine kinase/response regulator)